MPNRVKDSVKFIESVDIEMRYSASQDHFQASQHLMQVARKVENENPDSSYAEITEEEKIRHKTSSIYAVISSIGFLHSYAEEYTDSMMEDYESYRKGSSIVYFPEIEAQTRESIVRSHYQGEEVLEERFKKSSAPVHYNILLDAAGADEFESEENPLREAKIVNNIRNKFYHFSPRWADTEQSANEEPYGLERRIKSEFPKNPFSQEANPLFPDRTIGHGLAHYAFSHCKALVLDFHHRMGTEPESWLTSEEEN